MRNSVSMAQFLENFHNGLEFRAYEFFGCHRVSDGRYVFRVWAPHAKDVRLTGIFVGKQQSYTMAKLADGECFEVTVSAEEGDKYIYLIKTFDGREIFKADPFAFKADLPNTNFSVICNLPLKTDYDQLSIPSEKDVPINIYEVNLLSWKRHLDNSYYSFAELTTELVPYVENMGYTHVEFMPITEFPFDGSWGYQVTGYFSVVSRLGTPQDFKKLIDEFHKRNVKVIIDWVPAHFPKDAWGLYEFDGQPLYESPLWDRMEHSGWGTRKFDFGRGEVDSFLLSSAYYFFDLYNVDGLRVDAVASMLYLDYDRPNGNYTPNIYGENINLEAVNFIKKLNTVLKKQFPGAITIAEESTAYPKLTDSVINGGLGFDYKWNMGWMNDVLYYCRQDPYFRSYHHNKLTFSLVYAFSENFILPLSHDEVVHVKGSIVNKMPGSYEDKFAGERLLLSFMFAHPGKKLNFMGYEIAQFDEWNYNAGIEFFLAEKFKMHECMNKFVKDLNFLYRTTPPLYQIENSWAGFEWLVVDDNTNNLIAFSRYSRSGDSITVICNFSGIELTKYRFGIQKGRYRKIFDSDIKIYGGSGKIRKKIYKTAKQPCGGKDYSIEIDIPKLTCVYLIKE